MEILSLKIRREKKHHFSLSNYWLNIILSPNTIKIFKYLHCHRDQTVDIVPRNLLSVQAYDLFRDNIDSFWKFGEEYDEIHSAANGIYQNLSYHKIQLLTLYCVAYFVYIQPYDLFGGQTLIYFDNLETINMMKF